MRTKNMIPFALNAMYFILVSACTQPEKSGNSFNYSPEFEKVMVTNPEKSSLPAKSGKSMNRTKRFSLTDRYLGNAVVCNYEIPEHWNGEGQIQWNTQNFISPVTQRIKFWDPTANRAIEIFPGKRFFWIEPASHGMVREGQSMSGGICMRPQTPVQAFVNLAVRSLRGNMTGFTVVSAETDPSLIRKLNADDLLRQLGMDLSGFPGQITGTRAVVEYHENGIQMQEEFVGIYILNPSQREPYVGYLTQTDWALSCITGIKAEKRHFAQVRTIAYDVLGSVRYNPEWIDGYKRVNQQIAARLNNQIQQGYASIQQAGRLSNAISAQNDAFLHGVEDWRRSFNSSPGYSGGHSSGSSFSDYIRGTDRVNDPYWGEGHQIQGGYDYNYSDGFGNYIQTNDPLYNPNTDPMRNSSNWTLNNPGN